MCCCMEDPLKRIKSQGTEWEEIFASHIFNKGFVSVSETLKTIPNNPTRKQAKGTDISIKSTKKKYMKKCLASLTVEEMEIKTTTRYPYTCRKAKIKNSENTKCWQGYGGTKSPAPCCGE